MRIEHRLFRCKPCAHDWQGALLLDCQIDLALRVMRAIRCPQCGGHRQVFLLGGAEARAAEERRAQAGAQEALNA